MVCLSCLAKYLSPLGLGDKKILVAISRPLTNSSPLSKTDKDRTV